MCQSRYYRRHFFSVDTPYVSGCDSEHEANRVGAVSIVENTAEKPTCCTRCFWLLCWDFCFFFFPSVGTCSDIFALDIGLPVLISHLTMEVHGCSLNA